MNKSLKTLAVVAAAAIALIGGAAQAESKYGYNSAGTGQVSATASLTVAVTVPKLLLLRIGSSGALPSTATMTAALAGGIPGGVAPGATGDNLATGWSGAAPSWAAATSNTINAFAWTNSSGGGQIAGTVATAFSDAALAAKIAVASTATGGLGLTHPATLVAGTMGFAKNTVVSSDWVFSITAADLGTTDAGAHSQVMTYTATSL